jgi:hypothetical protein
MEIRINYLEIRAYYVLCMREKIKKILVEVLFKTWVCDMACMQHAQVEQNNGNADVYKQGK